MAISATLDKSTYTPGETMVLTVVTSAGERNVDKHVNGQASIAGSEPIAFIALIDYPPLAILVADPDRIWTKQSDDETTAVYTAAA